MSYCPTEIDTFTVLAENGTEHTIIERNEFMEDDAGNLLTRYHPLESADGLLVVTLPDDELALLTHDGPVRARRTDE